MKLWLWEMELRLNRWSDSYSYSLFATNNYLVKKKVINITRTEHRANFKLPKFLMRLWRTLLLNFSPYRYFVNFCSGGTKCLRHFPDSLTWILFNKCTQLFTVKYTCFFPTFFTFKALISNIEFLEPLLLYY